MKSGRSIAVGGSIYIAINFTLGLIFGFVSGFPVAEALVIAGITTIFIKCDCGEGTRRSEAYSYIRRLK